MRFVIIPSNTEKNIYLLPISFYPGRDTVIYRGIYVGYRLQPKYVETAKRYVDELAKCGILKEIYEIEDLSDDHNR